MAATLAEDKKDRRETGDVIMDALSPFPGGSASGKTGDGNFRQGHYGFSRMQESGVIVCPYCGQSFELMIDTGVRSQRFVTDCEICCRPFEVVAECEAGEILSLDVMGT